MIKTIKSFNIPLNLDSDFGWDVNGGKEAPKNELYARVSAVYRAIQLNSDALASIPFTLVTESGEDFDTSTKWENKVGFFPKPESILKLWRTSLAMTNSAYGFMERTSGVTDLRYIVPGTITPDVKDPAGLVGFSRQVNARRDYYPIDSGIIRHIFRLDYDTEILPSDNTEFRALMSSAGILFYADHFIKEFFKRGGIKPTILSVKGMPLSEDRTRIEKYWDRFMRGYYEVQGKIFNAETFTATPVGEGIAALSKNEVYRQAIENVAMATGIPISLLLSNSANFATAEVDMKLWFDWSVIPWAKFIARELTDNLFSDFGLRMEFRPEQVDPDATETKMRADTYSVLSATLPLSISAQIAGLTMPEGIDFEDLDEVEETEPEVDEEIEVTEDKQEEPEQTETRALSMDEYKELKDWRDIATRKHKRGELAEMTWEVKALSEELGVQIKADLTKAETVEDVKAAFDVVGEKSGVKSGEGMGDNSDIKALADALNNFASRPEPVQLTVNSAPVTVTTPEHKTVINPEIKQEPATVVVNVPEQPAPNVAVTNVVETPKVTVNNDVTVKPAPVTIKSPKKVKVVKKGGKIVGLESE